MDGKLKIASEGRCATVFRARRSNRSAFSSSAQKSDCRAYFGKKKEKEEKERNDLLQNEDFLRSVIDEIKPDASTQDKEDETKKFIR